MELDRSPTKIDLDDLVDELFGLDRRGGFLDEDTACGSPGPRSERGDVSRCEEVSAGEIASFLASTGDARRDLYIGWKRRDIENASGGEKRICVRCQVPFKPYDNAWNRAGLCSKACFHVHTKSTRKPG